jgi:hypothetical protein
MVGSSWRDRVRAAALVVALALPAASSAQVPPAPGGGQVAVPGSSIEKPGDTGVRAHTNVEIFIPNRGGAGVPSAPGGASSGAANAPPTAAPGAKAADGPARPQ